MGAVTFEGPSPLPILNSNLCMYTNHTESFGMGHSIILPPYCCIPQSDQKGEVDDLEMNRVRLFGGPCGQGMVPVKPRLFSCPDWS
jgi:hypothetical protein